jgi:choline dehydrogenase-like flavoprotein
MVILSSGALGTPSILERSGIGHSDVLRDAGVTPIIDLPGVGNNYQDHHLMCYSYKTSLLPNDTVDGIIAGRVNVTDLVATNSSILGWNAQDVTCKIRPSEEDVAALSPEFQAVWKQDFKNQPDKPLVLMAPVNGFPGDPSTVGTGQFLSLSTFSVYPYSRGSIHIKGPNIEDGVTFTTGFLTDPNGVDIQKHIWVYKKQREIMRRMKTYRGEVAFTHPPFPANSSAVAISLDEPLADDVPDIKYTEQDNAIIAKFIREAIGTTWHSLGTCKMAPREEVGVVDEQLGVYGVSGLKIADLSIPPRNVAANTANTAMTIGEKAADIFIKELGI